MPTLNPRVTVTLTPTSAAVLRELSQLAGNSQSAIVAELLESSLPVLERVVLALRAASTIQASAKVEIAAGLERAQSKLEDQLGLMLGDMDETMRPLLEQAEKVARRGGASVGAGAFAAAPKGASVGGKNQFYSALDASGKRVLLPVGKAFGRDGSVVDVAPEKANKRLTTPVPLTGGSGRTKTGNTTVRGGKNGRRL